MQNFFFFVIIKLGLSDKKSTFFYLSDGHRQPKDRIKYLSFKSYLPLYL